MPRVESLCEGSKSGLLMSFYGRFGIGKVSVSGRNGRKSPFCSTSWQKNEHTYTGIIWK